MNNLILHLESAQKHKTARFSSEGFSGTLISCAIVVLIKNSESQQDKNEHLERACMKTCGKSAMLVGFCILKYAHGIDTDRDESVRILPVGRILHHNNNNTEGYLNIPYSSGCP
uniref:Uncharacterized protein n=1 Tax=Schistocephalus solidus TaxID=70667 RepID=A0A0X3PQE0_SCHSO